MSRVRPIGLLFGGVVALVAFTAGCRVTVETKNRFVEENVAAPEKGEWTGSEVIDINIDGVGASLNGGVDVVAEQGRTNVEASARMLAMAFAAEKSNADQSIIEAKGT